MILTSYMIGLLSTHLAKLGRGACCLSPGWAWAMVVSLVGVAVLVTAPPPAPPPDPYPPHTVAVTCKQGCYSCHLQRIDRTF